MHNPQRSPATIGPSQAAVALAETDKVTHNAMVYLNRLSDFLFTLARYENHLAGVEKEKWVVER